MDNGNNEISQDFVETEESKKYIIIVSILYFFVIVLSILLILGIRHQRNVVKNSAIESKSNKVTQKNESIKKEDNKSKTKELDQNINEENSINIYDYLEQ